MSDESLGTTYERARPIVDRGEWAIVIGERVLSFTDRAAAIAAYADACRARNEGQETASPEFFPPHSKLQPRAVSPRGRR